MKLSTPFFVRMMVVFIAIVLCQTISAQINSSDECYYIGEGQHLTNDNGLVVVLFDGSDIYQFYEKVSTIKNNLKQDPSYYKNNLKNIEGLVEKFSYDANMSNDNYEVYSKSIKSDVTSLLFGLFYEGTEFKAFSKNGEELIGWTEYKGEEPGKKYKYIKIEKSELLPKSSN